MIVHMIGNAHLDPVWLWPWPAGVDEALATFRSAVDRCQEYDEFVYTRGEAWLYEQVERLDPALFERVRAAVARGQWAIVGGQYVQPDLNMPTAEALRRQFMVGHQYFSTRLGARSRVAYNVDSFGHPACLPAILAECGMAGYVFRRPEPHQMPLPDGPFRWRGGGAEVIAYRIPTTYVTGPYPLTERVQEVIDATPRAIGHAMAFYGVGNHGGGPTKGHIEWILEHLDHWPGVELRFSSPDRFLDAIEPLRDRLPVVEGDLQRCFPGCYSVMHEIKQAQRHTQLELERAALLIEKAGAEDGDEARLAEAWKDILFCDFHDIVTGTAAPSAWQGIRSRQRRAEAQVEETAAYAARRWARRSLAEMNEHQHVLVNPDRVTFEGLVEIEPWLDFDSWRGRWISDELGGPVDFQLIQAQTTLTSRLLVPCRLEPASISRVLIRADERPRGFDPGSIASDLIVSETRIANGRLTVGLDPGGVRQIALDGRELLGPGGLRLNLRQDSGDTWVHDSDRFDEPIVGALEGGCWKVEERGPLRARVRYDGMIGLSRARLTLSLPRAEPNIEILFEINCQERYRLVELAVDTRFVVPRFRDGLALGAADREADGREQPFHGWTLIEGDGACIALATHDAYSLSHSGGATRLTLLRTPQMAWGGARMIDDAGRRWFTDQGALVFRIDLLAEKKFGDEALSDTARRLALPPVSFDFYEGMDRPVARPSLPAVAGTLFGRRDIPALLAEQGDRLSPERAASNGSSEADLGA